MSCQNIFLKSNEGVIDGYVWEIFISKGSFYVKYACLSFAFGTSHIMSDRDVVSSDITYVGESTDRLPHSIKHEQFEHFPFTTIGICLIVEI